MPAAVQHIPARPVPHQKAPERERRAEAAAGFLCGWDPHPIVRFRTSTTAIQSSVNEPACAGAAL